MVVTVRKGTAADAGLLAQLRWDWSHEDAAGDDLARAAFVDHFVAWVEAHLATHIPFLADVDGRVVGMAWLMLAARVPSVARADRPMGDVQSVYVLPDFRDSGVGAVLLDAVLADARDRGLVHVTVHSSGRAVPFYRRRGFRQSPRWLEWRSG